MRSERSQSKLELWAGIECTVNRVKDTYHDQMALGARWLGAEKADMLCSLGASAVRVPVLWEHVRGQHGDRWQWSESDEMLGRMRELGIRPIVGLLHHGSGPRTTSLVDPELPVKLAEFAYAVAERYPWVTDWTPVNEPLTTARFSGLYGHWFPHGHSPEVFVQAFVCQIEAIVASMKAIRRTVRDARLVQTEDIGKTYCSRGLEYQAEFENDRRWLTFDALTGLLAPGHPSYRYLVSHGISPARLAAIASEPETSLLLGINHYVTSERFLDLNVHRWPRQSVGSNGRDLYADVEAVRALPEGIGGPSMAIEETWDRYAMPIAVTESHLGCTREEQMRWLDECWRSALHARAEGVDIRAVTVWSAFGSWNWCSLLTRDDRVFETGAYDLCGPQARPTGLAHLARELAADGKGSSPVLQSPGWWRRDDRLSHTAPSECRTGRPLLVLGASGTLGRALLAACLARHIHAVAAGRAQYDLLDCSSIDQLLDLVRPWAILNASGYVRVDEAESDLDECWAVNTLAAASVAEICARRGLPLTTFSSDLVFNGELGRAYRESDATSPLNVYGYTKQAMEHMVSELHPSSLIVRTSAFFGPDDQANFLAAALRTVESGRPFMAAADQVVSMTYVPDLANAVLDLLLDRESGVWHVAGSSAASWAEWARTAAEIAGLDALRVLGVPGAELDQRASRPANSSLSSARGRLMPCVEMRLGEFALMWRQRIAA